VDEVGDFDFLVGNWRVANRKLAKRLAGSDEWEEFESTSRCWRLFDGNANVDEFAFPDGTYGMTMRLYDPTKREWSLHWSASTDGALLPPVVGAFADGQGTFYGDDSHEGVAVRVRYVWSEITPTSARWEQAFSTDGQRTWETNWVMRFTRV
jgi:hypothetical protein